MTVQIFSGGKAARMVTRLKPLVSWAIMLACLAALWPHLSQVDVSQVKAAFLAVSPLQWIAAGFATLASFLALGQYDVIWHRQLRTGIHPRCARRSGMAAIAIGQTLGLGAVTGGFVRWRCLPGLSALRVAQITAAVSLSFMSIWALFALSAAWWLIGNNGFVAVSSAPVMLLLGVIGVALMRLARARGLPLSLVGRLLLMTGVDVGCAALALYLLLPGTLSVDPIMLLATYVLALGAGQLSNAPGGFGAFEAVFLALIVPADGAEVWLAAILAYRLIYYIAPFVIAMTWLATRREVTGDATSRDDPAAFSTCAAFGLARQSGALHDDGAAMWHLADAPLTTVALGDPAGQPQLTTLPRIAGMKGTLPAIYKCSARVAAIARQHGWHIAPVARRAMIDPQVWTPAGAARQGLRRKLRQAEKAGISVEHARHPLPLARMANVAADWAAQQGGELGFSMGRFTPEYVAHQAVFTILHGRRIVGFVTCHTGPDGWVLDLIRYQHGLPSGAMHLAIKVAIEAARLEGVRRFSLDAVPLTTGILGRLSRGRNGLAQFKRSFAPRWETLYHCAPGRLSFLLTGAAVTWAIQRPLHRWLPRLTGLMRPGMTQLRKSTS